MSIYSELQPVVQEILTEFAQGIVSYVRVIPGNGPKDDPGPSRFETVEIPASVRGAKFKYVQNGLAVASDLQVTTHGLLPFEPNARDMIDIDGARHKIHQMLPKPAAGPVVAFVFIVRKP